MDVKRLLKELTKSEGLRLKPYRDTVGKYTIGIGRNLEDTGISKEEAVYLCRNDIQEKFSRLIAYEWFRHLNDNRQEALVRMAFNMGVGDLLEFKKMIRAIKNKDWDTAAAEALNSLWARQVGNRAHRIADIIRSGFYPGELNKRIDTALKDFYGS